MDDDYFQKRSNDAPSAETPISPFSAGINTGPRATALSNKLTSVLSASYADLDIRDALEQLDDRKIENTQETRRRLRLDVQKDVIECNGEIIREFGQVAEQLKRIGSAITTLNDRCTEMRQHISAAQREAAPVLEEASSFMSHKSQVETKQQLLDAFNQHFTVTDDDLLTLTSSVEPVNDSFFAVLTRVKGIHRDCQVLLGTEVQTLGLDIMEQSSKNLNGAYQKLYIWIQREFKTLNLENPQLSSPIRRALRVLAERPSLFQSCLDFFAEAREHVLSDSFYIALTGSSPDSGEQSATKPIEFFAHDPLRYVGDMLAWTHSTTVSEREALEVLFISEGHEIAKGIQAGLDSEPWSRSTGDEDGIFDGVKALTGLVNRDMIGVGRMLRQRVEQVVQSHEAPTVAYQIANLINFYRVTFKKLLGDESEVLQILANLEEAAFRQFRGTMRDHVATVQGDVQQAPNDLSIPGYLHDALSQLKILMKSYDTSLAPAESRESDFRPILAEALDPFIQKCEILAQEIDGPGSAIFFINCLSTAKSSLVLFPFNGQSVGKIDSSISEYAEKLVDYQHTSLLHNSGLYPLSASLAPLTDSKEDLQSILSLVQFTPQALTEASQALDEFLPSALMDAMENLKQLHDSRLSQRITEDAAKRFCQDFEFIESKIEAVDELVKADETEEHEHEVGLRAVFPRTSGEIRILLS
ncbi:MAG: Golgi transport complex subunit 6 [Sclerophora amabilis]|nr:MAG: Golgi transport complex subunit 6 [Sclerophora amabilis]